MMIQARYYLGLNSLTSLRNGTSLRALNIVLPHAERIVQAKCYTTKVQPNPEPEKGNATAGRIHALIAKSKFLSKLNQQPRFRRYFDSLSETSAVSTVSSFLILHEVTAIIPLFGFWWMLYSLDLDQQYELPVYFKDLLDQCGDSIDKLVGDHYQGLDRNRLILSGAISYAAVKLLYPIRVLVSLWAAPYFLRWFLSPFKRLGRFFLPTKNSKK